MILLDGATGTELTRRGVDTTLPLWSARALIEAPDIVGQIHRDYVAAGASVLTANTFRANPRTVKRAGLQGRARELTFIAVSLARQSGGALIAGSMAPVEDCSSPRLVPDDDALAREHTEHARNLAEAGCDILLVETMNTAREAVAAARAASATGLPVWISYTLDDENELLSGEPLADAVRAVMAFAPAAILVNCIPVAHVSGALIELRECVGDAAMIGAYANVGHVDDQVGWTLTDAVTPTDYADASREWRGLGASIIGGCCGTTPEHIRAVRRSAEY